MDVLLDFSSDDDTVIPIEASGPTTSSFSTISSNSSVSDVVHFLKSNGIPEKFCHAFEGKFINIIIMNTNIRPHYCDVHGK